MISEAARESSIVFRAFNFVTVTDDRIYCSGGRTMLTRKIEIYEKSVGQNSLHFKYVGALTLPLKHTHKKWVCVLG